tara:strand:- start:568 stop:1074 length:507 start_codon:yes stop_codon:yes gene_type:complete
MGFGRIGRAIAGRLAGFHGKNIYYSRNRLPKKEERQFQAEYVSKNELLRTADVIVLILPYTKDTHHFIGETELGMMQKSAVLVNMARGGIVDDLALIDALKSGRIFSAALDVYENEPDINEQFFKLENAVLSPHLGSATINTRRAMSMRAAKNLVLGLNGHTAPDIVN